MGNYFQMFVNKFINASKEHIINIATDARNDIIKYASECASDSSFATGVLLAGASVGINGNGALNDSQKDLLDAVFAEAYNGSMEEMYSDIVRHNSDNLYHILGNCAMLGNSLAIPLLNYTVEIISLVVLMACRTEMVRFMIQMAWP